MEKRCLYCYEPLNGEKDLHKRCSQDFFWYCSSPVLSYSIGHVAEILEEAIGNYMGWELYHHKGE